MQFISKIHEISHSICIAVICWIAFAQNPQQACMGYDDVTRYVLKSVDVIVQSRRAQWESSLSP